MTILEGIKNRRSIRKYKVGAEVTDEQIKIMLEAAMMAPSACNSRPWEFIVIKDRGILDQIRSVHPNTAMLETASIAIIVVALPEVQEAIRDALPKGYYPQDCGAATQNILLAATALGLGTCWCGVYPKQNRVPEIQKVLNTTKLPFCVIAVGVPDESPAARGFYDESRVTYM